MIYENDLIKDELGLVTKYQLKMIPRKKGLIDDIFEP